jgi:tRNA (uracil-5-)-methyltransferase TRM9
MDFVLEQNFNTKCVSTVYNNIASHFDKTRFSKWPLVTNFLDKLEKYSLVADVGSGNGKYINYRNDLIITGNDISIKLALIAKKIDNQIILASGINLPYRNNLFDYTISIAVLHHLTKDKHIQFINELIRITKKKILISVWSLEQKIKPKWTKLSNNEYAIPWSNKIFGSHFISAVYDRYYYLFAKKDIEELMSNFTNKYELIYDNDNWFILISI